MARRVMPTTQAIREAMSPSEAEVKRQVCAWLTLNLYHWIRVQCGSIPASYGGKFRRIVCAPPGTADILVLLPPNGYALWIEVKSRRKGSKQSHEQVEFAEKMAKLGAGYRIVRDLDELPAFMREEMENAKVRRA